MWGLIDACREAGASTDDAVSLMKRHSPLFAQVEQVASSNCHSVNAGTFWYFAQQHGYKPPRHIPQVVQSTPSPTSATVPADPSPLRKIESNELLSQLRAANNLRYNIFTQQIERKASKADYTILENAEHYYSIS